MKWITFCVNIVVNAVTTWHWTGISRTPTYPCHWNTKNTVGSAGLTIVANAAIATGPALLGALRSSVINLICYIIYTIFFSLRSQYFAKFAIRSLVSEWVQFNTVSINSCLILSVHLCNKRHEIAVSGVAILADLLLKLAGLSHC